MHIQNANPLWPIKFVGGDAHQVDRLRFQIPINKGCCLNSVRVEKNIVLMGQFAYGVKGLEGANFIVGGHDTDENRVWPYRFLQFIQINFAHVVYRQNGQVEVKMIPKLFGCIENSVVFDGGNDKVIATAVFPRRPHHTAQGHIIAF